MEGNLSYDAKHCGENLQVTENTTRKKEAGGMSTSQLSKNVHATVK